MRLTALLFLASSLLAQVTTAPNGAVPFETKELLPAAATNFCSNSTVSVTRTSGSALSIGASSSASAPQYYRFGTRSRVQTAATTLTISAGSGAGTAYIYAGLSATNTLALVVFHNSSNTMACASGPGCTVALVGSSVYNSFMRSQTRLPLWNWTMTSGAWDTSGGTAQNIAQDCWVDQVGISAAVASTIIGTDGQGTAVPDLPTVSLPVNSYTLVVKPGAEFYDTGLVLTAGTASALTVRVKGWRLNKVPGPQP